MTARRRTASSSKGAPPAAELAVLVSELEQHQRQSADVALSVGELRGDLARALEQLATCSLRLERLEAATKVLDERMSSVFVAVDEGIRHVDRAEKRVRATVGRAQRQLAELGLESPGVDAEAADLQVIDAATGEAKRVQAVREAVDADPAGVAADPLLTQLQTLRLSR